MDVGDCTALAEVIKDNSTIPQLNLTYSELGTGEGTALAEEIDNAVGFHTMNLVLVTVLHWRKQSNTIQEYHS